MLNKNWFPLLTLPLAFFLFVAVKPALAVEDPPWIDTGGKWSDPSTWVQPPTLGEGQFQTEPGPRSRLDFFREFAASIFGPDEASTVAEAVENKGNPAAQIIFRIVAILLSFLGGVSVLFGVYAAFLWMTAGGNEETIGKARTLLLNAVMGLALILSALLMAIYLETTVAGVHRVKLSGGGEGFCEDRSTAHELLRTFCHSEPPS